MKRVVEVILKLAEELHSKNKYKVLITLLMFISLNFGENNNNNKDSRVPEVIFISHGNFLD